MRTLALILALVFGISGLAMAGSVTAGEAQACKTTKEGDLFCATGEYGTFCTYDPQQKGDIIKRACLSGNPGEGPNPFMAAIILPNNGTGCLPDPMTGPFQAFVIATPGMDCPNACTMGSMYYQNTYDLYGCGCCWSHQ